MRILGDDVNGGYLPENLVLAARREEIAWVHSEGVYEIVLVQKYLQMQARNCWISSGWTQTSLWTPLTRKFDRDCVSGNTRRRSKAKCEELYLVLSCFLQCDHLKL